MASATRESRDKLIVDSIHGDIHLTPIEQAVVDTVSFQRLRHLKQLGMAHVTYPNATHTRFAHSVGVLGIMEHVTRVARETLSLSDEQVQDIRLAGLLHDIGHYPYSHLMERIDKVQLTEEFIGGQRTYNAVASKYPSHEEVGELIVTKQTDLIDALGGQDRAKRIAELFTRKTTDLQLSKLIHSSLDMDRLDYLLRDAHATGVPYGHIDLNYLVNSLRVSPSGLLGVGEKALAAVEHFLLARFFMHKSVYYHKTTFGIEEVCRQLLRRVRDQGKYNMPRDGHAIRSMATGSELGQFTDAFVDGIVDQAGQDRDPVVAALANSIRRRRPPKLLREVSVFEDDRNAHEGVLFKQACKHNLGALAASLNISPGRFLVCATPPLTLEQRGWLMTEQQARQLEPEESEQLIKVFVGSESDPVSVVSIKHSILKVCSNHFFQSFRLYFVRADDDLPGLADDLQRTVCDWRTD